MANISLTSACNRDCAYCFARTERDAGVGHIGAGTFGRALGFLERSGIPEARLLGGEPTLHPRFPELAEMAVARGFRLFLFSNGLMPESALRYLESLPPERLSVLINASPRDPRQDETLRRLAARVTLGYSIQTPDFEPVELLETVREFGLKPEIRFGLAHPIAGASNAFLHPHQYTAVGERLSRFARTADPAGVRILYDCGFTPCMFPPGEWQALGLASSGLGPRCSPILDVLPDSSAVSCLPLVKIAREEIREGETAGELRARFSTRLAPYRRLFIYPECHTCGWREAGECAGGCLSAALLRLRHAGAAPPACGPGVTRSATPADGGKRESAPVDACRPPLPRPAGPA